MGNTSNERSSAQSAAVDPCGLLLQACLSTGEYPHSLLEQALGEEEGRAFLSRVVEPIADSFDPTLDSVYQRLFRDAIEISAPDLVPRVRQAALRTPGAPDTPDRIFVLSRVTLGADIVVTSVLLDALKRRYPDSPITLVGSAKAYGLFAADSRIDHQPAPYSRGGSLSARLHASAALDFPSGIVVDPDSRLTQLGLIRVCDDSRYFFFPSRGFGGDSDQRLSDLAAQWAERAFGVSGALPYIAIEPPPIKPSAITISLGVGENESKRLSDSFESRLMDLVADTGASVLIDKGATPAEAARVERVLRPGFRTHEGAFAPFASLVSQSRLFIGYDSAAGHVASVLGVPQISIAAGFPNPRMAARWRAKGDVLTGAEDEILSRVHAILNNNAARLKADQ